MALFAQNKRIGVQSFVLKIVNNSCPELRALVDGPRLDRRVNLTMVVLVVPLEKKRPQVAEAFTAVTKEFSATGVGVVLDEPQTLDKVLLGFRWEAEMVFVRAEAMHLSLLGGGFYQLGFRLIEIVYAGDYPELRSLDF